MTAKEYLTQAIYISRILKSNKDKVKSREMSLDYKGQSENIGSSNSYSEDKLGKDIISFIAYKEKIERYNTELMQLLVDIEKVIYSIPNELEKSILELRYLSGMDFQNVYDKDTGKLIRKGIAEELNYSSDWVKHKHGTALSKIKVPTKNTTLKNIEKHYVDDL